VSATVCCPRVTEYRDGMARLAGAVNVLTTDGPSGFAGMTVSAVVSVTDQPPTLLVCVQRGSYAFPFFEGNGVLAVSVLAASQQNVAQVFADRAITMPQRRERVPMATGVTGSPLVEGALVAFDCRVSDRQVVGSHAVLICEVLAVHQGGGADALVWLDRAYRTVGVN